MNIAFSCEGCKFAVLENNVQLDCSAGMFERYEARGFHIGSYDVDGVTHCTIEGKMGCKMFADESEGLNGRELIEKLRFQNELKAGVVIFVTEDHRHDSHHLYEAITKARDYCENSTLKPSHIYFVDVSHKHIPLRNILNTQILPFTYTICSAFTSDKDKAISDCKSFFDTKHLYIVGDKYDYKFLGKMNEIMVDGAEEYALAYDGFGGYLTKSELFQKWNGNDEETFEFEDSSIESETYAKYTDKVEFFARQNGQDKFIYRG